MREMTSNRWLTHEFSFAFQGVTSIGMLHIGVVFVVFGIFLLGAGLITDDASAQNAWSIFAKDSWWNELVLTGLFAMGLGIFLIILNSVISKKEDDDLEAYVQSQLTRSRSGNMMLIAVLAGLC